MIPEGDSQGSGLAGMQSVPYMLELVRADDIEAGCDVSTMWNDQSVGSEKPRQVERLPAHKRRLHLFPSLDKARFCISCAFVGCPWCCAKASGRYVAQGA